VSATTSGFESASKGENGQVSGDHNHEHKTKVSEKCTDLYPTELLIQVSSKTSAELLDGYSWAIYG
jgi:hypothetical protein